MRARLDQIPHSLRRLTTSVDNDDRVFGFTPTIQSLISFRKLNLIGPWPMRGPFDVIFFRNVGIYFKDQMRERVLERMTQLLVPNGLLFLGHSETLPRDRFSYTTVGPTIYRRQS